MHDLNSGGHDRGRLQARLDALATRLDDFRTRARGEPVPSRAAALAAADDMARQRQLAVQKLRASGDLGDRASAEILESVAILLDDLEESLTDEEAIRTDAER
ncbi:MAG: hypothetical protein AB7N54_05520 [Alphaproteobacteria bacterium]